MLHWCGFSPAHYQRERDRETETDKKRIIKLNQFSRIICNKLMVSLMGVFGEVLWLTKSLLISVF